MAISQEDIEQIAKNAAEEAVPRCRCAVSFNLVLGLTDAALKWARDNVMQKYVPEHLERIATGLDYLEKDCNIKAEEARLSNREAVAQSKQKNWKEARARLDDLYIQIDRKVTHCAGYKSPHF